MKLLFDNIIFELQRAGGISVYWSELISRWKDGGAVFFGRETENIFGAGLELRREDEIYPRWLARRYLPFRPKVKYHESDKHIFHSSYLRYSGCPKAINVTTVHDFTYEHYVRGGRKWIHSFQKKMAVSNSAGIICVSENTKKDLLEFYPWLEGTPIRVIHNGVGDSFYPLMQNLPSGKMDLPEKPFLLFVGDRSSYKNFDAFVGLAEYFPDFALVAAGGKSIKASEAQRLKPIANRFFHFRGLSSENLNCLYNAANCLVYPSSYEGFGIPVLEAMKAGCPVVATNVSSIPEVAGDAALLVNEPTPENLAAEIRRLKDSAFRSEIIEKGIVQAANFSWDKCFEETCAFYRELWDKE